MAVEQTGYLNWYTRTVEILRGDIRKDTYRGVGGVRY